MSNKDFLDRPTAIAGIDRSDDGAVEEREVDADETQELIQQKELESRLRRKVDLRLCTIAGILCSLNLLDSGIISSASVTTMLEDLDLKGTRYSVSIFIFTIASVVFQLPSTIAVRFIGPRIWFAFITFCFGLITLCAAFVQSWRQMIALRILLGISMSGIYPGLTYLISTWYTRREQQLRFAFLQSGEVIVLATGSIVNYGLNHLDGRAGLAGWRWMFLVQGLVTCSIGIITYWWMVDFPENAQRSFYFLSEAETRLATQRIQDDRDDLIPEAFSWSKVLVHFLDPKLYGFCCMFFLLNLVSTSLSYFLPIILQSGMGFSENASIILSAPVLYPRFQFQGTLLHNVPSLTPTQAILLRRPPRPLHLPHRRQVPYPRSARHPQRPLPHRWLFNVRPPDASHSAIYRHLPRHRSIRFQLGGTKCLPSQQYRRPMEACHRRGSSDGM